MMMLVIGGSGSGKSAYAEKAAVSLSYNIKDKDETNKTKDINKTKNNKKDINKKDINKKDINKTKDIDKIEEANESKMKIYYLAAMQVFDEEGYRKVERHRRLRSGKGFLTIEQPTEIHKALEKMEPGERTVLVECISNLTANEMFSGREPISCTQTAENILKGITQLKEKTSNLVVVSNNVFEDGITYDKTTMEYIRAMGMINQKLAALADQTVEIAAGIPVVLKRQEWQACT